MHVVGGHGAAHGDQPRVAPQLRRYFVACVDTYRFKRVSFLEQDIPDHGGRLNLQMLQHQKTHGPSLAAMFGGTSRTMSDTAAFIHRVAHIEGRVTAWQVLRRAWVKRAQNMRQAAAMLAEEGIVYADPIGLCLGLFRIFQLRSRLGVCSFAHSVAHPLNPLIYEGQDQAEQTAQGRQPPGNGLAKQSWHGFQRHIVHLPEVKEGNGAQYILHDGGGGIPSRGVLVTGGVL